MKNDDLVLSSKDPRVDALVEELVSLKPIWDESNLDYLRSVLILKELNGMNLSPWKNSQVAHFIRLSWADATRQALALSLIPDRPTGDRVSTQIAGLCLVQARINAEMLIPA